MTASGDNSIRRRVRRSILVGLASVLVAGACAGAATAETFHVGGDLSLLGVEGREPDIAVNDSGDQAFAWRLDGCCWEVQARLRTNGVLGQVRTLSAINDVSTDPRVAILPNGDALVVWNRYDETDGGHRVEAQTLSTTNVLGPLHTLSTTGGTVDPQLAVDASGNAVIAWHRWNGEYHSVQARTLSAAGTLGADVIEISDDGEDARGAQVAFDANGVAVLGWTNEDGAFDRVQTRTLSPAGTLGDVADLSNGPNDASDLQLAVEPDGDALYAWQQLGSAGYTRVKLRTRSAAGVVSAAVETISGAGVDADEPQLGVDADGDAVLAWLRDDGAGEVQVKARTRTAAGTLGSILTLSRTGQPASHARIAVSANGTAAITWNRSDGANAQIKTRKLYASGVLGALSTLSDAGLDADEPAVAIDDHGSTVHAWRRLEPIGNKIQFDAACCAPLSPSDEVVLPRR